MSGAPAAQTGQVFPLAPADGGLGVDIQRWDSWLGQEGGGVEGRSPEVCVLCRRSECPWSFFFSPERKGRSPRVSCGRCPGCSAASTLTQMKCLYPTPPNQAKTDSGGRTKMSSSSPNTHQHQEGSPQVFLKRRDCSRLGGLGVGEGRLLEELVLAGPREGSVGGCLQCLAGPFAGPQCPTSARDPRGHQGGPRAASSCHSPFLEPALLHPLWMSIPTQGGNPSRPGVLNDAPPLGPVAHFSLGPHVELPIHFCSCQMSVCSFWGGVLLEDPRQG